MKAKLIVNAVLFSSIVVFSTQDITGKRGCDCSICKSVDNKLNPLVGNKANDHSGDKSTCNICEKRKEMLRLERERKQKLQKCPFEILGAPAIKGKSSQEVFDEFRELIVPSQNGFFDMMRGIVKTMHFSSEAELQWAKEKEAKELAKKKEEELRKMKEVKTKKEEELVSLQSPINPKVTVVLKQTPCGQILAPSEKAGSEPLIKRLPKEINEDTISHLQSIDYTAQDQTQMNYMNFDSKENLLDLNLIDHLVGLNTWSTVPPQETTENVEPEENFSTVGGEDNLIESTTDSRFVKFVSNDELKAQWRSSKNADDIDFNLNLLPTGDGKELQEVDTKNVQNVDYSIKSGLL